MHLTFRCGCARRAPEASETKMRLESHKLATLHRAPPRNRRKTSRRFLGDQLVPPVVVRAGLNQHHSARLPGVAQADRLMDAQDAKDRHERMIEEARRRDYEAAIDQEARLRLAMKNRS